MPEEGLVALVDHLDGAVRAEGEHAGVHVHGQVLAGAERPAGARQVQPHPFLRQPQARRHLRQVLVEPLRSNVEVYAAGAVGYRQARLGTQEGLILDADLVGSLDDYIGVAIDAPAANRYGPDHVAVGVDGRSGDRQFRVGHRREGFVRRDDRVERQLARLGMIGGHDGDRLTLVTHDVVGQHGLIRQGQTVGVAPGNILGGEHRRHTRDRQRLRDVDRQQSCVGMGRAQRAPPQHGVGVQVRRGKRMRR